MHRMVITQIFYWLTFVVGCCAISGCSSYRTIRFEVLNPAQATLFDRGRVFLLNRNAVFLSDTLSLIKKRYWGSDVEKAFNDGVNYGLSFAEPVDTAIVIKNNSPFYFKSHLPVPLPPDLVNQLCHKFGMKQFVSLEAHFYSADKKNHSYNWYLRIYDSNGQILDSVFIEHRLKKKMSSDYLTTEILQKSWDTGKEYTARLRPHWTETERRVYRSGRTLRLGYLYFKTGKTDEAMDVWMKAQHLSPGISLRASVNLGWLYENAGDLEGAAQVLEDALQRARQNNVNPKDLVYLDEYFKTIVERIADIKTVQNQTENKDDGKL